MRWREALHLGVGAALVWGVGASWLGWSGTLVFVANSAAFVLAFVIHELAHKLAAGRRGYPAEFRLYTLGALLTAASILMPLKIVAPGATVVWGPAGREDMGRIALWGPLSNIVMGCALLASSLVAPMRVAVYVNAFLALFNLLPAPGLDGRKVLRWSPVAWGLSIAASAALLAVSL